MLNRDWSDGCESQPLAGLGHNLRVGTEPDLRTPERSTAPGDTGRNISAGLLRKPYAMMQREEFATWSILSRIRSVDALSQSMMN